MSGFFDVPLPFGFAHQGGTDVAPGNTEASFDHAVGLGYRYIETDVHATYDGVLVVFHDDDLEPTTGVGGPIEAKTWAEVAQLRVRGEHPIQRFDAVLDRYPGTRFNVEPKGASAVDPLIELVRARKLLDQICIGSFSDRRVARMKGALGPTLCTSPGPLGLARILLMALVWPRWHPPHVAVQIPRKYWILPLATPFWIRRLHRMGLQVHVWTINLEPEMRELLDDGADAIMSDKAVLLREVLVSRGQWPETPVDDSVNDRG